MWIKPGQCGVADLNAGDRDVLGRSRVRSGHIEEHLCAGCDPLLIGRSSAIERKVELTQPVIVVPVDMGRGPRAEGHSQ